MPDADTLLIVAMVLLWGPPALDMLGSALQASLLSPDPGGDPAKGLVIFVEPTRAFGIPWGVRHTATGLRRAGFEGEFRYWPWQAPWRAWLIAPVIMGAKTHAAQARRLAEFIARTRHEHPDRPLHVIGYSAGGHVAAAALEMLDADVRVDSAVLLAPAISPRRDLSAAAGHVAGKIVVASSLLDWFIIGLSALILGTCDRRHALSAGMIGLRDPQPDNVSQIRWRPSMIRLAHWGGHFGVTAPAFIARHIAPEMALASQSENRPGGPRESSRGREPPVGGH